MVAVYRSEPHARSDARFAGRFFGQDVDDRSVGSQLQAERILEARVATILFRVAFCFGRLVSIDQPVSSSFDSTERGSAADFFDTCLKESLPIVWCDAVERFDHAFQRVRLHLRRAAGRTLKGSAEIVDRFPVLSLSADNSIGFEPDERPFFVEIHAAAQ